ncbi:ATP-dependent zinc metalloprotease FtsH [Patescibacteria group bacterium]|nr:ATP-dependent zinc metalloprotease FtsH [Patescibacteria group bacterium]MBU2543078.1 ATP-dependent zinc metalloprotease FtsH [Patescibacteria group bacterium]
MAEKKITNKKPPVKKRSKQPQSTFKKVEVKVDLNKIFSKGLIYLIIGLLFVPFLIQIFSGGSNDQITISQLVRDIREQKVTKLDVAGQQLRAHYLENDQIKIARKEEGQQALEVLTASGIDLAAVDLEINNLSFGDMLWELVLNLLPILLMVIFFLFIFRQARGAQDGIMGFGRSKAKVFIKGKQDVNFGHVGGMDEAKAELEEIVDFLKNPKKYQKVGARTPKGVLLVGPAGTGKTLLARAVAGEANVQFLSIAGSEFMEMLVGVGASRARDLFQTAKKMAPSIIFIDEIDAIGRQRSRGSMGGNDEREQTLNQILVEMDGFTPNDNVMVMAATNRGDLLDPALVRPGRFDRRVIVRLPDLEERKHIIKIHAKSKPFAKGLNWDRVAKRTVGFSGADIENMLNEAAIAVARDIRSEIKYTDIEEASLKVKLGRSKKRLHDVYERKLTAYHEAGHAVIAHVLPHTDPVHRISIVSRGMALGYTLTPPEKDKVQITRSELLEDMVVMLGGRAAEDLIFRELTAGASSDIKRATAIARSMVIEYGMSNLGPMNFGPQYESNDYGMLWGKPFEVSDNVQAKVDEEIGRFINDAQAWSTKLLKKYKKQLDMVAAKLLEVETLDADEFSELMGIEKAKPDILT